MLYGLRMPAPEPRGLRSFDADLPVLDSAIGTITEQGAIYRGVYCVENVHFVFTICIRCRSNTV